MTTYGELVYELKRRGWRVAGRPHIPGSKEPKRLIIDRGDPGPDGFVWRHEFGVSDNDFASSTATILADEIEGSIHG